ncbi:MAG: hypothetical protein Q9180_007765 [Flavoplaca navasiana]
MTEAQDLPYLQAVIKETLRILPGLGNNFVRVIPEGGLTIADHFFPAGVHPYSPRLQALMIDVFQTMVGMNAFVAHANRDVFGPDADEFRPERWLGHSDAVTQIDQYFLSFGRGPRSCVGKNIALLMLNTLIPELVLRFDFEPMNLEREWTVYNDTFMYQEGFQVKVHERVIGGAR